MSDSESTKNYDSNSNSSSNTDVADSSASSSWKIEYKPISDSEQKGAWDGYQTREEFFDMHLR